eukprot:3939141-Rhodomonas_salina.1
MPRGSRVPGVPPGRYPVPGYPGTPHSNIETSFGPKVGQTGQSNFCVPGYPSTRVLSIRVHVYAHQNSYRGTRVPRTRGPGTAYPGTPYWGVVVLGPF